MRIEFSKYQGTGNDFVIIDNRHKKIVLSKSIIAFLCDRRFGIGADGLMFLENEKGYDFRMVYYNSDGRESSFCGNGSRCIVAFAKEMKRVNKSELKFIAADGAHIARIESSENDVVVSVKMRDVRRVERNANYFLLNTGSPHYVRFASGVERMDMFSEAKKIRYSKRFHKEGVNVNFVEKKKGEIFMRTYERGVESETLSCGTGVTAVALSAAIKGISTTKRLCKIKTPGGNLTVKFNKGSDNSFTDVWLKGPATFVYKGIINI